MMALVTSTYDIWGSSKVLPFQSASSEKEHKSPSLGTFMSHAQKRHVSLQLYSVNLATSLQGVLRNEV